MPDFSWSEVSGRYRNRGTGRFVSETEVRAGVDVMVDAARANMVGAANDLRAGTISAAEFQDDLHRTIRDVHVASALAAYGGQDAMTPERWGYVGSRIKEQYQYARRFVTEVVNGNQPMNGRVNMRAGMYAEAGRVTYEGVMAREARRRGFAQERNVLHAQESCTECRDLTVRGWVPAGALPPVGSRICLVRCKCTIDRRGQPETVAQPAPAPTPTVVPEAPVEVLPPEVPEVIPIPVVVPPLPVGDSDVSVTPVRSKNGESQIIGRINDRTDIRLVQAFGRSNPNWQTGMSAADQQALIDESIRPALAVIPKAHISDARFIMLNRSIGGSSAGSTGLIPGGVESTIRIQFAGKEGQLTGVRPDPQIIVHEIGHALTPKFTNQHALSWLRAVEYPNADSLTPDQAREILVSDAVRSGEPKVRGVSGYGETNARESWAEAYRAAYAGHMPINPDTPMGSNRQTEKPDSELHRRLTGLAREIGDSIDE